MQGCSTGNGSNSVSQHWPFFGVKSQDFFLDFSSPFFFFSFSSHYLGVYFHFPPVLELLAQHLAQGN